METKDIHLLTMIGTYLDIYFLRKMKEIHSFMSFDQRLQHVYDLVDYYNKICNDNSKNLIFTVIA